MDNSVSSNARDSKACTWSFRLAIAGVILIVIGFVGARSGLSPMIAMLLLSIGSLVLIIAAVTGAIGLIRSGGSGGGTPAGLVWGAIALGLAAVINAGLMMGGGGAPIHDISTDTVNPPQFIAVAELRGPGDNPVEYAGQETAQMQADAYPDIETIVLLDPRSFVFATALDVAEDMGWDIVASDREEGRIEATATTPFVGFKDDIVIRVSAENAETHVDIRSKSRIGKGDMGVNAGRIRDFSARLIAAANPQ
jgi:hypothetical protein